MKLRPYPEYKDSGVPWLGEVPADWKSQKIKRIARKGYKTFIDGDWIESPYIRSQGIRLIQTGNIGVGKYREKGFRYIDEKTFKEFKCTEIDVGDILICRLGEPVGRACLAPDLGVRMITSVDVCILKPAAFISPSYMVYAMSSPEYLNWVGSLVRGSTRDRISRSMLGGFRLPLPSFEEQTQIARFLDWKTAQIDRFIHAKRRLIERLKEQKQALINQAVTGTIDVRTGKPYPEYKDSGVPWLGKVPAGWEVRPLKHTVRINTDVLPESTPPDFEFRYMEISDVGTGELVNEPETVTFGKAPSRARRRIEPGDTIISTVRTYLKAVLHITEELEGVIVSTGFAVLRPKSRINQEFLGYLLQADAFINQVIAESVGVSYPAIAETRLGRLKIAYPINIEEQEKIVSFIEQKSSPLTGAITRTQREIDLIQEYRTRLIADVVTGKLDVREVAVPEMESLEEEEQLATVWKPDPEPLAESVV